MGSSRNTSRRRSTSVCAEGSGRCRRNRQDEPPLLVGDFLQGTLSGALPGAAGQVASGVRVIQAPGAGHNVMFDRPDVLAAAVAGRTV